MFAVMASLARVEVRFTTAEMDAVDDVHARAENAAVAAGSVLSAPALDEIGVNGPRARTSLRRRGGAVSVGWRRAQVAASPASTSSIRILLNT